LGEARCGELCSLIGVEDVKLPLLLLANSLNAEAGA
jgi:hypothetical protein